MKCKIEGCSKKVMGRGMCSGHYRRFMAGEDLYNPPIKYKIPNHKCQVEGCVREHAANGLCQLHYYRNNKGIPLDKPLPCKNEGKCKIDGCENEAKLKDLCKFHYQRIKDGTKINLPKVIYRDKCTIEGCSEPHASGGFCKVHHRRWKRDENWRKILEIIGDKCKICGNTYHHSCYDFHHRDPKSKDSNVSNLMSGSIERILLEVEKCDLLCANCHRKLHYNTKIYDPINRFYVSPENKARIKLANSKEKRNIPTEEIDEMIRLRKEGKTMKQVALIHGMGVIKVRKLTNDRLKDLNERL